MKMTLLCLRDLKANAFAPPIFRPNIGVALRDIGDALRDPQNNEPWKRHPEDFELYDLGTFDTDTAEFQLRKPSQICLLDSLLTNPANNG